MARERVPILIVGAGLAGAATAFHLRRRGVDGVVLLEKEPLPGVHASGRNAAMLRERMDDPRLQRLASASAAALRGGALAAFRRTGGYLLPDGTDAVAVRIPLAAGSGTFHAGDGVVDVAGLLQAFLAGQDVRYGTHLERLEATDEGLLVHTNHGPLHAGIVVNAAGPWAGVVGDLPLEARKRHLFVSEHDPAIPADAPFVWDTRHGYYLRPESGGWLLCACDETVAAPGDYTPDPEVLEILGAKLRRHQPALADLRIARTWVGQRTFAPDALPVVGFDPRTPGLFHVAGLGGHGVTLSHGVGRLAAAMLAKATRGDGHLDPARLLASVRAPSPGA